MGCGLCVGVSKKPSTSKNPVFSSAFHSFLLFVLRSFRPRRYLSFKTTLTNRCLRSPLPSFVVLNNKWSSCLFFCPAVFFVPLLFISCWWFLTPAVYPHLSICDSTMFLWFVGRLWISELRSLALRLSLIATFFLLLFFNDLLFDLFHQIP